MLSYIYIPFDAFQRPLWLLREESNRSYEIIGYHIENSYVVIDIVDSIGVGRGTEIETGTEIGTEVTEVTEGSEKTDFKTLDPELKVIGSVNLDIKESIDSLQPDLIRLRYDQATKLPFVDSRGYGPNQTFTIVFFEPPNLRNLEYFTVRPILLQITHIVDEQQPYASNISRSHIASTDPSRFSICNERVLDKINGCAVMRSRIMALSAPQPTDNSIKCVLCEYFSRSLAYIKAIFIGTFMKIVRKLIFVTVWLLSVLNTEVCGVNPVESSSWCRQLDLRLRQVSYFPFQFWGYHDPDFLRAPIREALGIPLSNERRNINNSNYINLYNTLWLILNDILFGRALHHVLIKDLDKNFKLVNEILLDVCFTRLDKFISWIGSDYPGGFKLNNDLGSFMELLFLWTSQTSREAFQFLAFSRSGSGTVFVYLIKLWFTISCYLGLSFTIACFSDYIKMVNSHTRIFCLASTKIYFRQIEMLKSLWQLFRGRKYNVLRSRIDKIEEDQLRIDQLLLGTFVFLILIYLLPTTFAFYLLFYLFHVSMNTLLKFADKAILTLNLYPLFVLLLKLKNSRRLQGGVHFTPKGRHGTTEWVLMENKALTLDEICGNFYHVFRQEGRLERFFLNFVEGRELQVKDTWQMKHQYLMLPKKLTALDEIWMLATEVESAKHS